MNFSIRDITDLESLVTEDPRDMGDLVTRGEGGGAIGVTEPALLLVSEIMMDSRLLFTSWLTSSSWICCKMSFLSLFKSKSVSFSRHLTQADPEYRVFYWELVIDIAEVWVTNSSAYLHMIILGLETRQVILIKHLLRFNDEH